MSQMAVDIERIVRAVLADFGAAPAVALRDDAAEAPACPPAPPAARKPSAPADALVLTDRVVTLAQLDGRAPTVRRLVVPEGAVVTPAVRDELRRRRMALEYGSAAEPAPQSPCNVAVWNVSKRYDPSPLMAMFRREGVAADLQSSECLIATTGALATGIRRGDTVGLILTRQPAVALCLANRHPGVRAVLGLDAPQVAADLAAVGGNLLAVDWAARSLFQIKQMASELCRGAPRACPDALKERLA